MDSLSKGFIQKMMTSHDGDRLKKYGEKKSQERTALREVPKPCLQVLSNKIDHCTETIEGIQVKCKYILQLSDGEFILENVRVASYLEDQVIRLKTFKKSEIAVMKRFSLIRVHQYLWNYHHGRDKIESRKSRLGTTMVICELDVEAYGSDIGKRLGNPQNYYFSPMKKEGPIKNNNNKTSSPSTGTGTSKTRITTKIVIPSTSQQPQQNTLLNAITGKIKLKSGAEFLLQAQSSSNKPVLTFNNIMDLKNGPIPKQHENLRIWANTKEEENIQGSTTVSCNLESTGRQGLPGFEKKQYVLQPTIHWDANLTKVKVELEHED